VNVLASLIGSAPSLPAPTATPTKVILPSPTPTLIAPTSTPISATPTVAPTSGSTTSKTYDDKNSAFAFSSGWKSISTTKASGGSYRETTQNGATATLTFTGQSFSIIYKGGITFSKFDVYVDGALVATLNQKLSAAAYQQRWDYPGQLAYGSHKLKLVFKVTSSTINRGSLDAVIVR
jgi:hypothetical protein